MRKQVVLGFVASFLMGVMLGAYVIPQGGVGKQGLLKFAKTEKVNLKENVSVVGQNATVVVDPKVYTAASGCLAVGNTSTALVYDQDGMDVYSDLEDFYNSLRQEISLNGGDSSVCPYKFTLYGRQYGPQYPSAEFVCQNFRLNNSSITCLDNVLSDGTHTGSMSLDFFPRFFNIGVQIWWMNGVDLYFSVNVSELTVERVAPGYSISQ